MAAKIHPKCPDCGHALYKSLRTAKSRKDAPYKFCRNIGCKRYLQYISDNLNCSDSHCLCESEFVANARVGLAKSIYGVADKVKIPIALIIAILLQEISNNKIANQVIDFYDLHRKYGIKRS